MKLISCYWLICYKRKKYGGNTTIEIATWLFSEMYFFYLRAITSMKINVLNNVSIVSTISLVTGSQNAVSFGYALPPFNNIVLNRWTKGIVFFQTVRNRNVTINFFLQWVDCFSEWTIYILVRNEQCELNNMKEQ